MTEIDEKISWVAPEFVHYPKSRLWFFVLLAAAALLVGYFSWQKEFLTAVLFAVLFLTVFYFSRAKPREFHIEIDKTGIKLNASRIRFSALKSFWIIYEPPEVKTLNFETTAYLNRFLTLQIENEDPVAIRFFLLKYLPEDLDRGETMSDILARKLKF